MLVSHLHRFIYTKTVKTAGTSVESYFERFCMPQGAWRLEHQREEHVSEAGIVGFRGPRKPDHCTYWNQMPAGDIKQAVGDATWAAYFKFCVVRNPYDKVVSAYYHMRRAGLPRGQQAVRFGALEDERGQFERWLLQDPRLPIDRDKYLIDDAFCLDHVVRYESLQDDLAGVCAQLGLPWQPVMLPGFKTGIRPPAARAADLYSEPARAVVAQAFAFELDFFRYAFPGAS